MRFRPFRRSTQVQYNYNTTAIQYFFSYCSCIALVWTPTIQRCNTSFLQLAENLQATCSSCKKNLYCSCIALVRTAAIQQNFCYFIVVVLHCANRFRVITFVLMKKEDTKLSKPVTSRRHGLTADCSE